MTSRDHALFLLHQSRLPGWHKVNLKVPSRVGLDPRDRALGESIAMTVTKNLVLLRHLVKHYSGRELKSIDPLVQMMLAIALAQLRFFTRVPPSAAVDEAVEQSKRFRLGRASGFINAVLRRATREPAVELPKEENLEQYAHIVLSHPPELFRRYVEVIGWEKALALAAQNNTEPPTIVRADSTFPEAIANTPGVTVVPHRQPGFYVLSGANESHFAKWAADGIAQVQDPTAAGVVKKMRLVEGLRAMDRCCGVGTKTIQIARQMKDGLVVAVDPSAHRIERLNQTLKQLSLMNVQAHAVGMLDQITIDKPFDRVLIDAPCSNSGVIQRRPEARFRQDDKSLASIQELQRRILIDTASHLALDGLLIYSTCSIWPEENGDQIQWLLSQTTGFEILSVDTTLPSISPEPAHHHDGGFTAILIRKA